MINELAKKVHYDAIEKGFYDNDGGTNMGERIALIHSELSEALEADRNGKYCELSKESIRNLSYFHSESEFITQYKERVRGTFEEEIADLFIRALDMVAFKDIDIESHINAKMRYNRSRENKNGKKY